ncbi:RAVE complex protein Rav1 C-terminal [Penicillium argentinense]|uniref:RAVE complex protein Rav1 C-terminal n=1 Tax=Penicillium argentinense TaxID=1131581 RepID=A0A9W9EIJ6_9EURO|nr:RAVE complex protein Rav1 C-terminal [Penicillium argentinense]KAJ5082385.1 RAVE complex protein Rav1 C-terminal [Penicillium argentinense]
MRAVLPGRPPAKLQSFSTALWDGLRVIAYISGHALVILGGPQTLLQTIYVDDTDTLQAVAFDEESGKIAVCGGADVFVYQPYGIQGETLKWSLAYTFRAEDDDEPIYTLSWGSENELLVGNSHLALWFVNDNPRRAWKNKLATPVKYAQFSPDAALIVTVGLYDRLAKVWRRLAFGDEVRFEVSYLPHPNIITGVHWRLPHHRGQYMENVLYTLCADNKIRVWAAMDHHALSPLQFWTDIDMNLSVQPREATNVDQVLQRRYGFILDSRDFCAATERAVERNTGNKENHALEHIIEVAKNSPEICVVIDGQGHMSAWALEDVGSKAKTNMSVFNILHVEGLDFGFMSNLMPEEDYAQICMFQSNVADDKLSIVLHHFDGRIEWWDSQVDVLFDPAPRPKRIVPKSSWSGHTAPVKKIVRNALGDTLVSRTDENKAMIWKQRRRQDGSMLIHKSTLFSEEHIHRTCVIENGHFLVNLHHNGVSLWDFSSYHAKKIASLPFTLSSKPLCVLPLPTPDASPGQAYVATIAADMHGIAWEIRWSGQGGLGSDQANPTCQLQKLCEFDMGLKEDLAYILPVDPAGPKVEASGFFDSFSPDIALSYTHSGVVRTWTAKVDRENAKVEWLLKSTVDTGIENPSLASGSSIRKAALVDQDRTHLTIWDTNNAQLEFEEHFAQHDVIRDLDWTSTPDMQSILAVGFPHKVVLLSQLRYDYLDSRPSWTQIREIWIRDLTPHPIGDSCWLTNGHLVIGAGNQLFVYDKDVDVADRLVSELRIPSRGLPAVDIYDVVSRLNGPLPVFHPQFLAQCILAGKTSLVHSILMNLHRKLKFYNEGDDLDGFLELPAENFYEEISISQPYSPKEMRSSFIDAALEEELSSVVDENIASILNENLSRVALPRLSSQEQFRLVDTIECVAMVEKHRRSMDDNAARYFLFFRQHMLRKSQGVANKDRVSWREIVWAFHSGSQDILTDLASRQFNGKMTWKAARESGIFMWLSDLTALRAQLEIVARSEYTKTEERNPIDCTLYYLALGKKNILQGLWRIAHWHREQNATSRLLANDFKEARWKTSALKNAYALLGKRRFEYAAAFFLLADHLRDGANVVANQMGDIQLAITITRAYEGDNGPVLKELLEEKLLPEAAAEGNRWMASWAFWMLGRRDMAVRALISPVETLLSPTPASPGSPGRGTLQSKSYLSNDPALVVLYHQLREKTLQTLKGASQVHPREEWDFVLRNARLYDRMGCDLLALDLVRHWEFLGTPPTYKTLQSQPALELDENGVDYRKLLRRRSSLVVADMPVRITDANGAVDGKDTSAIDDSQQQPAQKPKPPPTMFHEPDANSLLDSFGF